MILPIHLDAAIAYHVMPVEYTAWSGRVSYKLNGYLVWSSLSFNVPNGRPCNQPAWTWTIQWRSEATPSIGTPPVYFTSDLGRKAHAFEAIHIPANSLSDGAIPFFGYPNASAYCVRAYSPPDYGYYQTYGTPVMPFDGDSAGDGVSSLRMVPDGAGLTPLGGLNAMATGGGGTWVWGVPEYIMPPWYYQWFGGPWYGACVGRAYIDYLWWDGNGDDGGGGDPPGKKPGRAIAADIFNGVGVAASLADTAQNSRRVLTIWVNRAAAVPGTTWASYNLCEVDEDSPIGISFLQNGVLVLSYEVNNQAYYRQNTQFGLRSAWTQPAITTRHACALNSGRALGQTWRVRT